MNRTFYVSLAVLSCAVTLRAAQEEVEVLPPVKVVFNPLLEKSCYATPG